MTPDFNRLKTKKDRRIGQKSVNLIRDPGHVDVNVSVLYVSHSVIPLEDTEQVVQKLALAAARANEQSSITGALIFTGRAFAQYLEGDAADVGPLLQRIRADTRHEDMIILMQAAKARRRFAGWSLAYNGLSPLVTAIVERARLSSAAGSERGVRSLISFMERFSVRPITQQSSGRRLSASAN